MGIAAEYQPHIFDAFVQLGNQRNQKGTGLGLTTRQFVKLMGGWIHVESTRGKGSRFNVELLVKRAQELDVKLAESALERISGLEPGQPDCRVLIIRR